MARSFVLGRDHKLYAHAPGESLTGTRDLATTDPGPWTEFFCAHVTDLDHLVEVDIVQDVTVSMSNETADASTRASGKWAQSVVVTGSVTVDFSVLWKPSNSIFQLLFARWVDGCPWAFLITDSEPQIYSDTVPASSGCDETVGQSYGLWADFVVTSFDWNQPRAEPATADVTLELALGLIVPEAVLIWPHTDVNQSPLGYCKVTCA